MNKLLLITLLFSVAQTSFAESTIRIGGKLIDKGSNINELYRHWGNPKFNVSSERSCGRVIIKKKTFCSKSRKVWDKQGVLWLVQHKGNMIIKIDWTRFESHITKKI